MAFGGLYVATELEKCLAAEPDVEVTLINRENFFLFTPMLHEVAASDLDLSNIVNPVRKLLRRVHFFAGDVESVEFESKKVTVSHGTDHHHHELDYDYLVVALGSMTNFFNLPGLEERALTMKSLGDAIHLRNRLIEFLEEADTECAREIREPLLTFVVAGGGFAGVETIAGINDFVREALKFYPNLTHDVVRMVLVHPGPVILPELGEKLGSYAQKKLARRGVDIRVNTKVTGVSDDAVELSDGTRIGREDAGLDRRHYSQHAAGEASLQERTRALACQRIPRGPRLAGSLGVGRLRPRSRLDHWAVLSADRATRSA